jgi:hypothetical protein
MTSEHGDVSALVMDSALCTALTSSGLPAFFLCFVMGTGPLLAR